MVCTNDKQKIVVHNVPTCDSLQRLKLKSSLSFIRSIQICGTACNPIKMTVKSYVISLGDDGSLEFKVNRKKEE